MFLITPLSFYTSSAGNPHKYPHKIYIARNYSHWPTPSVLIVWVYLHSNFCGGCRKMHVLCNVVCNGHSGSSKVTNFGTTRKRVCNFLLVTYSNFGPILPCFRNTAGFLQRTVTVPRIPHEFCGVPHALDCRC